MVRAAIPYLASTVIQCMVAPGYGAAIEREWRDSPWLIENGHTPKTYLRIPVIDYDYQEKKLWARLAKEKDVYINKFAKESLDATAGRPVRGQVRTEAEVNDYWQLELATVSSTWEIEHYDGEEVVEGPIPCTMYEAILSEFRTKLPMERFTAVRSKFEVLYAEKLGNRVPRQYFEGAPFHDSIDPKTKRLKESENRMQPQLCGGIDSDSYLNIPTIKFATTMYMAKIWHAQRYLAAKRGIMHDNWSGKLIDQLADRIVGLPNLLAIMPGESVNCMYERCGELKAVYCYHSQCLVIHGQIAWWRTPAGYLRDVTVNSMKHAELAELMKSKNYIFNPTTGEWQDVRKRKERIDFNQKTKKHKKNNEQNTIDEIVADHKYDMLVDPRFDPDTGRHNPDDVRDPADREYLVVKYLKGRFDSDLSAQFTLAMTHTREDLDDEIQNRFNTQEAESMKRNLIEKTEYMRKQAAWNQAKEKIERYMAHADPKKRQQTLLNMTCYFGTAANAKSMVCDEAKH